MRLLKALGLNIFLSKDVIRNIFYIEDSKKTEKSLKTKFSMI
jgi:hypothetical protein